MSVTLCAGPAFSVRYRGSSISCGRISSATQQAWNKPHGSSASGALPWGLNAAQVPPAQGVRLAGPAQVQPATRFRRASAQGARAPSAVRSPAITSRSVRQRIPPNHVSNSITKVVKPAPVASVGGGSVTLPAQRRVSMSPCRPKQGCSIPTTAKSHMDGQIHGASVITTAHGGSIVTSGFGSSVSTNPPSDCDTPSCGGSVTTAAARGVPRSIMRKDMAKQASGDLTSTQVLEEEEPDNMNCTVVAFKECGSPLIWRLENKDSGKVQTIVEHEDGSVKAFGDSTMSSIEKAEEAKTLQYADSLSDIDLRGFVHEIGQRVTEQLQKFNTKRQDMEELRDALDREYFGIDKDATKNDLDRAYRKLARKMHPDKNGGTDYAKQAFQNMFDRYKRLRSKCRESANDTDLADRYVDRVLLRACAKEDEGVRRFVDRLSAKAFRRASRRDAAKDIQPEPITAQVPKSDSQPKQPEKTPGEDYNSRSYLWKQVKILIREYKVVRSNLEKLDEDLETLSSRRLSQSRM